MTFETPFDETVYLEAVPAEGDTLAELTEYARAAEAAGFDALGFPLGRALEPTTLLSALAVRTTTLGLVADVSPAYAAPYNVARYLATLDHLSRGRAGWRLVATDPPAFADLHGGAAPAPPRRAARAAEYLDLLPRLWDSWDDDAIPADREHGVYVDEAKIRETRWTGPEFRVHGPLDVPRSPQGHPVLAVEVVDAQTLDLAVAHADLAVLGAPTVEGARGLLAELAARAPARLRPVLALPADAAPTAAELSALVEAGFAGFRLELDRAGLDRVAADVLPALGGRPVPTAPVVPAVGGAGRNTFRDRLGLARPRDRSAEGPADRVEFGAFA
ncbi:LLM class flavin-dependent oxidoreductase [Pseudonocardia oroxyli]|uniref:Luciferase-like monooxygenase n=1 Tax=Pseudonocardia oroxyli TaxID=366584 RepID=A0A1G8C6U1_PSEOR|nr:LLM class flavin-dependent oxidoreductase [Pseudonocardia oroxyli]SDH41078.1 Luciferase-like monooxygenase [Pseudonocardia oroxyli]